MARDWKYEEGSQTFIQWWRSCQQLIQCPPGQPPTLAASVQQVRKYADGTVTVTEQPALSLSMDTLTGEDLDDALLIQAAMFRIIARRVDPDSLIPEPEPEPEPAP